MRTERFSHPEKASIAVWLLLAATLVVLPLRVIQHGFLPPDDALRHAAKAVSGKEWAEILVLRPEITIDHNPGWHVLLGAIHRATGWGTEALVQLSIVAMFLLFVLSPMPWLRRPELWVATVAGLMLIFPYLAERGFVGRPFFVSIASTIAILLMWRGVAVQPGRLSLKSLASEASPATFLVTTILMALSTWIHGSWYLLILLPIAFLLAGQWKKAIAIAVCWIVGTIVGAAMTGAPWTFLKQSALIPFFALRTNAPLNALVGEFQPLSFAAGWQAIVLVVAVVVWRQATSKPIQHLARDPVLWLAVLGWLLGFRILRFWLDWGVPALALWLTLQFDELFGPRLSQNSVRRLGVAALAGLVLIGWVAADRNARWSRFHFQSLDVSKAEHAQWLPAPGGILYSVNLSVFYETFFANPRGEWRYALGFEPSFMTEENLAVYEELWRSLNAINATAPWVERMSQADRLILLGPPETQPAIPALHWHQPIPNTWVGRKPTDPHSGL